MPLTTKMTARVHFEGISEKVMNCLSSLPLFGDAADIFKKVNRQIAQISSNSID